MEAEIRTLLHSPEMVTLRVPSTRDNIKLSVDMVSGDLTAHAAKLLSDEHKRLRSVDRMIAFVMRIDRVDGLAAAARRAGVATEVYHSELTETAQATAVGNWRSGKASLMVATSGFGTGVDYAEVRLVVHIGGAYGLLSLAQEAGRAGRDGRLASAVLLLERGRTTPATLESYVSGTTCRVQLLAVEVDGQACAPCLLSTRAANACDNCIAMRDAPLRPAGDAGGRQPTPQAPPPPLLVQAAAETMEQRKQAQAAVASMTLALQRMNGHCIICVVGRGASSAHAAKECPEMRMRCLHCCQTGHWVRECAVIFPKIDGKCYVCSLPGVVAASPTHHSTWLRESSTAH